MIRIILVLFCLACSLQGQQVDVYTGSHPDSTNRNKIIKKKTTSVPFHERLVWLGNFSINYYNGWLIFMNPRVGIRTDKKNVLIPGIGGILVYTEYRGYKPLFQTGPMAFTMVNLTPQFFLSAEFYYLNQEDYNGYQIRYQRMWLPYLYVGGGYRSMLTDRFGTTISILYNVMHNSSSIWNPTLIQVGFIAGI